MNILPLIDENSAQMSEYFPLCPARCVFLIHENFICLFRKHLSITVGGWTFARQSSIEQS